MLRVEGGSCELMRYVNKIIAVFDKIVSVFCNIFMIALIICVAVQVFSRFVINTSTPWTETLSIYCYAWLTLFGAVLVQSEGGLLYVDVIQGKLGGRALRAVKIVCDVVSMIGSGVWCYAGILQCVNAAGITSWGIIIPLPVVYAAVPVSFAFLFIFLLLDLMKQFMPEQKEVQG